MNPSQSPAGTAVVIGGSIAGCTAAAALQEQFEKIIILDRDELPGEIKDRKGAPHAYQFHALTCVGREAMEELLPGMTERALQSGVPAHDPGQTHYCSKFGFMRLVETDKLVLLSSRLNLEQILRARTRELPSVEMVEGAKVTGLCVTDGVVTGVEVVDSAGSRRIDAALVVDASGRTSAAPAWLAGAGYPEPEETTVNAKWGYVTTYVRPGPDWNPDFQSLYISPTMKGDEPRATRGAGTWKQEGDLWVLTAQGCSGDYPPADEAGFREFLGSFGRNEFSDVLSKSEIVGPLVAWRNTTNRLRDYVNLQSRPENFILVGDAVAAFNPIYGQGMSSAARGARLLRDELRAWSANGHRDLTGFGAHFHRRLDAAIIQDCWSLSAGSDFNVPGVQLNGEPYEVEPSTEQMYAERVLALATEDEDVARKLVETIQMMRTAEWMGEDDVRAKVAVAWDHLGQLSRNDDLAASL